MMDKTKSASSPKGVYGIFFIQVFSTLSFAVLNSTLVLYMTKGLQLSPDVATSIMGGFIAFNFGLHLIGGYFGGRFFSFRNLFVISMVMQLLSCWLLSFTSITYLYWGLAFFLAGSGLNVTCINMMLTQLFKPEDKRRETAFLINYSGMNLGFLMGYTLAGYYELQANYHELFIMTSLGSAITLLVVLFSWRHLRDRDTPIVKADKTHFAKQTLIGSVVIVAMVPALLYLLKHSQLSNRFVISLGIFMLMLLLFLATRQETRRASFKMYAYIVFAFSALVFQVLYQLAPMGLILFAQNNVHRHFSDFVISPQWFQNINNVIIILGGPLMVVFLRYMRSKGFQFSLPFQFSLALLFIGVGFLFLPIGIHMANAQGLSSPLWICLCFASQSIGELFLCPIGYAMVGQLAPKNLQGIMMGTWMMVIGVAGVIASYVSAYALSGTHSNHALVTNAGYSRAFEMLAWSAITCGVILFLLVPILRRLVSDNTDDNERLVQGVKTSTAN